jgi:hypothetical protein
MDLSNLSCGHGCVYGSPRGVGANGGCHCLDGLNNDNRRKARKAIHAIRTQWKREATERERELESQIALLEISLEAADEMYNEEYLRAENIYEGNLRKKKKLREKIAELEKELLQQKAKADAVAKTAMETMVELTGFRERESELIAKIEKFEENK